MMLLTPRSPPGICCSLIAGACLLGCGSATNSKAPVVRSPSLDYQQPVTTTTSARSLGADRVPSEDKLQQGPRVGTENALAPGWKADKTGMRYDEKHRVGGATSVESNETKANK